MMKDEIHTEEDRLDKWHVTIIAVVGLLITAASIWVAWLLLVAEERSIAGGAAPLKAVTAPRQISGVRQTLIQRDREGELRRKEAGQDLGRYHWVDREKRLVRIPIRRAMEMRAKGVRP